MNEATTTLTRAARRGVLIEEQGQAYMADNDSDSDEARVLRPLQAAACTYRIAFGPRAGQKVLTVQGVMPRAANFKQTLYADIDGFSLHAAVRCGADDRRALEQLCRYITRPPNVPVFQARPSATSGASTRCRSGCRWKWMPRLARCGCCTERWCDALSGYDAEPCPGAAAAASHRRR